MKRLLLPFCIAVTLGAALTGSVQALAQDTPNDQAADQDQTMPPPVAPQQGTQVVITSSMPRPTYGPPPRFEDLDTNRDGVISEREAEAYPLLANDFLYASHHHRVITRAQYKHWARHAGVTDGPAPATDQDDQER